MNRQLVYLQLDSFSFSIQFTLTRDVYYFCHHALPIYLTKVIFYTDIHVLAQCEFAKASVDWISYNDHCYWISEGGGENLRNYTGSTEECRKLGANLTSMADAAEANFLVSQ